MAHRSEWPDERGGRCPSRVRGGGGGRGERGRREREEGAAGGAQCSGGGGSSGGRGAQRRRRRRGRRAGPGRARSRGGGSGNGSGGGSVAPERAQVRVGDTGPGPLFPAARKGSASFPAASSVSPGNPAASAAVRAWPGGPGVRGVSGDLERAPGSGRSAGRGRTNFPELGSSRTRRPPLACFPDIPRLLHLVSPQYRGGVGGCCAPAVRCPCAGDAF